MSRWPIVLLAGLVLGLIACAGPAGRIASLASSGTVADGAPPGTTLRARQPALPQATLTPSPGTPTPATPTVEPRPDVVVWWAADVYPLSNLAAEEALTGQVEGFREVNGPSSLWVRVRRVGGVGGITSTLRSASQVAPGALPDLALVQRQQMLSLADAGLIYPLDDLLPATMRRNLYPQALALGQNDEQLFGLAYLLRVPHVVYRATAFDAPPTTFSALLAAGQPFIFAAGQEGSISETLLIQYLAAGGRVADDAGVPTLDEVPLLAVLEFYERAAANGQVSATVLDYAAPESYWDSFLNGELSLVQTNSTLYLAVRGQLPNAVPAAIPTLNGQPLTLPAGWLWALTTPDPDRQQRAIAFLDWLMRAENQAAFAQAIGFVPSQRTALRLWDTDEYTALLEAMLDQEEPVWATANTTVALALQSALEAVLTGEASAAAAAQEAIAALP